MKKGRMALGAIAAFATVGAAFAFNVAHKFSTHLVRVKVGSACPACTNLWTRTTTNHNTSCKTSTGASHAGAGTNSWTFYTNAGCTNPITKTTTTS